MIIFVREPSLSQLLRRLGLEKYSEVFHKNEIDMQLFLTMTDKELKEVGNNFGRSHVNLDLEDLCCVVLKRVTLRPRGPTAKIFSQYHFKI